MFFGERLDEETVRAISVTQKNLLFYGKNLNVLEFMPFITKFLYRNRLKKASELQKKQKDIYVALINERRSERDKKQESGYAHSYVGSLLDVKVPNEGGRNLTEDEIVGLCAEFIAAGSDPITFGLQWIMAELVKDQEIHGKLFYEITKVIREKTEHEIKEDDLHKFPYLKAVVLEALRRHPPSHFTIPHAPIEETTIEGYTIPKNAAMNFEVAEIGRDERVWANPMEFKPERFLEGGEGEGIDLTGTREIRMMPFGAGRRICPGANHAMLLLEYFVVNLVKEFEWKSGGGEEVDVSEKFSFIALMKNPLKARIIPRKNCMQL